MVPVAVPRKPGEPYICQQCGATYPHDGGYKHESFDCPNREGAPHDRERD